MTTFHYKSQNSYKSNFCYNLLYMHLNSFLSMNPNIHMSNFFHMSLNILQRSPNHIPFFHLLQKRVKSLEHAIIQ